MQHSQKHTAGRDNSLKIVRRMQAPAFQASLRLPPDALPNPKRGRASTRFLCSRARRRIAKGVAECRQTDGDASAPDVTVANFIHARRSRIERSAGRLKTGFCFSYGAVSPAVVGQTKCFSQRVVYLVGLDAMVSCSVENLRAASNQRSMAPPSLFLHNADGLWFSARHRSDRHGAVELVVETAHGSPRAVAHPSKL